MTTFKCTVITVLALMIAAPVWAAEVAQSRTSELASAKQKLARKDINTTGGPRQELLLEQRRLQNLIDDLQAGKHVDPAEIDRELKDAERNAR